MVALNPRRGSGVRALAALIELGLERGDARLQGLVLLAGKLGHVAHGLELLALDQIEVGKPALRLAAEQGLDLAPHPLGDAGGIVHQPRDLVEEPIAGLRHGCLRQRPADHRRSQTMATAAAGRKSRGYQMSEVRGQRSEVAVAIEAACMRWSGMLWTSIWH